MSTVQVEVWQLVGLLISFFSAVWLMGKALLKQIDVRLQERFETQERQNRDARAQWDQRFGVIEAENRKREREHLELRAELPEKYVRSEDFVRNQTIIEAKLDGLAESIENMRLRNAV